MIRLPPRLAPEAMAVMWPPRRGAVTGGLLSYGDNLFGVCSGCVLMSDRT